MSDPVGYFITWTCYGSWVHGDDRRSVDAEHHTFGTAYAPADRSRSDAARRRMRHAPVVLNEAARAVVHETIAAHCDHRGWELCAVNVRSNHVHVVVGYAGCKPETVMGELKARCSRRLHEAGLIASDQPVWTVHGSTRYLWNEQDVRGAAEYVLEGQDSGRFEGEQA